MRASPLMLDPFSLLGDLIAVDFDGKIPHLGICDWNNFSDLLPISVSRPRPYTPLCLFSFCFLPTDPKNYIEVNKRNKEG
jgi:hypothetical protein